MIVRQFLRWVQTAAPGERAEATSALARAFLYSDLSEEDRLAAEAAMTVLLDDPSPLVRSALAQALSGSPDAPHGVILALAQDQPEIAAAVAARSISWIWPGQAMTACKAPWPRASRCRVPSRGRLPRSDRLRHASC